MNKGILVYSDEGDTFDSGLRNSFFRRLCNKQLVLHASNRIDRSYITISGILQRDMDFMHPNIFVVTEMVDRTFTWEDYQNQRCFLELRSAFDKKGKILNLTNIILEPSILNIVCIAYGSRLNFITDLFEHKKQTGLSMSACQDTLIEKINLLELKTKVRPLLPIFDVVDY